MKSDPHGNPDGATTVQVDGAANQLLEELRFRKRLTKTAATSEAVKHWAPRVLAGEIGVPLRPSEVPARSEVQS